MKGVCKKMKKYYNSPEFGEAVISEDVLYNSDLDNTVEEPEELSTGYDDEVDFIAD